MSIKEKVNNKFTAPEAWHIAFGSSPSSGKVFCPFHQNTRTPAAKLYNSHLYCFGECNRAYTAYDILKQFAPEFLKRLVSTEILENTFNPTPKVKSVSHSFASLEEAIHNYYEF